ncbi:methionine ABC transporter substrate-binding protein [Helicobacter monodelphidis]|uniref:MetQ/NlpA family ABC transporter substrate-binding protein n=1 Tax=Helicobacter sp. 15-1451 TaxID=2004995 RepID=UPI000DCCDB7F|nr:MetQ/NlpA family ABC transporter substrate-binding protein [Helicobacter sp. 15-1451]RAX58615.1 methionine ABC transporter substrate-binding protein [Helicobacter sp. 15-1451]
MKCSQILCGFLLAASVCIPAFAKDGKIVVGASPEPHALILEQVVKPLKEKGIKLEIQEFNDYVVPNLSLNEGSLDANFFQHEPYLKAFNADKKTALISVAKIHVEPIGLYSYKIKKISELKNGSEIAIPNDPSNAARSLRLLEKEGLIKLKKGDLITIYDITENPKQLKFKELEGAQLPRVLNEVDAAVINTNFALLVDLNPLKDAIALEDKESPYANILVVKSGNENDPDIQELIKALQSDNIKRFINNQYKGAILPSF